jgi:hypothetical protein
MRPRVQAVHIPQQPHERVDVEQEVADRNGSCFVDWADRNGSCFVDWEWADPMGLVLPFGVPPTIPFLDRNFAATARGVCWHGPIPEGQIHHLHFGVHPTISFLGSHSAATA